MRRRAVGSASARLRPGGVLTFLAASLLVSGTVSPRATVSSLRAQATGCLPDAVLTEAATTLLVEDVAPTAGSLSAALAAAGSDLPSVQSLRAPLSDTRARDRFLRSATERADAPLVCGEAEGETTRVLLVAARGGRLDVDPASNTQAAPRLRVALARNFRDAYLAGRDGEDQLHRWPVDQEVLARGFDVPPDLAPPVVFQLVATGPDGPRPLSRRVVGERDDSAELLSVDGDDDLATRVATLRAHQGVRDLRVNRLLGAEAAAHAARVCSSGRVRHQGVEGDVDDPRERLRRRGIDARVVGETVARGRDLQAALRALSESPSHRMTLVDPRFTDVGYGTVRQPGGTCVVALFAAWPRYVPR